MRCPVQGRRASLRATGTHYAARRLDVAHSNTSSRQSASSDSAGPPAVGGAPAEAKSGAPITLSLPLNVKFFDTRASCYRGDSMPSGFQPVAYLGFQKVGGGRYVEVVGCGGGVWVGGCALVSPQKKNDFYVPKMIILGAF